MLNELQETELETVTGGLTAGNALTCDIAGGLSGVVAGIIGSGIGPVAGAVAAVFVGNSVKELCVATIEK